MLADIARVDPVEGGNGEDAATSIDPGAPTASLLDPPPTGVTDVLSSCWRETPQ